MPRGLLVPVAFQVITLSNSTAVAVNSTVRGAKASVLDISVETNACRMRADGSNPTLTTGVVIPKDQAPFRFSGYNRTSLLKFQRTTGTSKVSIMAYKYLGD
jgi:hypothetical protein